MKAITEDFLRVELRNTQPEVYYIPEGKILTPAAREYLQQRKIKVAADMGKVIGKQGRIAKAIRTVMKAVATRENVKVVVEIV